MPRSFGIEFIDVSALHRATADSATDSDEMLTRANEATPRSQPVDPVDHGTGNRALPSHNSVSCSTQLVVTRAADVPSGRRSRLFLSERERS
jgi:hypothetical protein